MCRYIFWLKVGSKCSQEGPAESRRAWRAKEDYLDEKIGHESCRGKGRRVCLGRKTPWARTWRHEILYGFWDLVSRLSCMCEMGDKVMHEIQLKRSTKARLWKACLLLYSTGLCLMLPLHTYYVPDFVQGYGRTVIGKTDTVSAL